MLEMILWATLGYKTIILSKGIKLLFQCFKLQTLKLFFIHYFDLSFFSLVVLIKFLLSTKLKKHEAFYHMKLSGPLMEKRMGDVTTKNVIGLCHILPKNNRSYQSLHQHLVIPFFLKTNISCYIHHYESLSRRLSRFFI